VVGDDVAGYHGPEPIPPRLYIRWAQFAAFTGLFLNGGHGERRLWLRSPEELDIIRRYAWLHTELVPYMYTHVVRCHAGGLPLMRPAPGRYHYEFGDSLLVAPIHQDRLAHTVTLPAGRWRHLFHDAAVLDGPRSFTREFTLADYPVYVREGSIIPLNVSRSYSGFGGRASEGYLTWAVWPQGTNQVTVQHPDRSGTTTLRVSVATNLVLSVEGVRKPHILRVLLPAKPVAVSLDGQPLAEGQHWSYDLAQHRLWIKTQTYAAGQYVIRTVPSGR
jgi:alpha-glucosidase (family GH31 glycosyl hydrolase)